MRPAKFDSRLADRLEIQDVMYRYARAIDRLDWDAFRATFHPGAVESHGPYRGGIDPFIELLKKRHAGIAQSMHLIGNIVIDFAGPDTALVESYFTTFQRLTAEAGPYRLPFLRGQPVSDDQDVEVRVAGRYVDTFTRMDGAWRVARRTLVYEVYRGQAAPRGGGLNADWVLSRRDGNDHVEERLRELGLR